jgi:hypothetical protein
MPIKHLTAKMGAFPTIGKLRKGAARPTNGTGPGRDLEYFRLVTDDEHAATAFRDHYGDRPASVNIFLPFATPDHVFTTWMEDWKAGGLVHRCDGENVVVQLNQRGTYDRHPLGEGPPCPGGCTQVGRLAVVVPELQRLVALTVETHSKHDIIALTEQLRGYHALRGSLLGIPFILRRVQRQVSTPDPKAPGRRVRRVKWLLQLEPAPHWVAQQMIAMQAAALPALPSLPAPLTDRDLDRINEDLFGIPPDNGHTGSAGGAYDLNPLNEPDAEPEEIEPVDPFPAPEGAFSSPAAAWDWAVNVAAFVNPEEAKAAYSELRFQRKPADAAAMRDLWVTLCQARIGTVEMPA